MNQRRQGEGVGEPAIGILGGTGPLGTGLALRWATAGRPVIIGSRVAERAQEVAGTLAARLAGGAAALRGAANADAADADIVVVTVPFASAAEVVTGVADKLAGRVLVSTVVPLAFDKRGPHAAQVEGAPSVAELLARRAPDARVVAGFHSVAAAALADLDTPLDDDVLLCGDDEDAVGAVAELVAAIDGATPVVAGPLRLSAPIEGLTAVLIAVNQRNRTHVGVRLSRLPRPGQ